MGYASGTLGAFGDAGKQLYDKVAIGMTAVAGWSQVDTWTESTATCFAWKSAVAQNGVVDFHVVFRYLTTNGTELYVNICEDFDTATNLLKRPGEASASVAIDDTYRNTDGNTGRTQANSQSARFIPIATGFDWQCSVTAKRLVFATKNPASTEYGCYAGLFDSNMNLTDDPYPIILTSTESVLRNGAVSVPAVCRAISTRHPRIDVSGSLAWGHMACDRSRLMNTSGAINKDLWLNDSTALHRWEVRGIQGTVTTHGRDRGLLLNDVAWTADEGTFGDTMTVGGETWSRLPFCMDIQNNTSAYGWVRAVA